MRVFHATLTMLVVAVTLFTHPRPAHAASDTWRLTLRYRTETTPGSDHAEVAEKTETWNPRETAVIVCDMWDAHHCLNATRRVQEMAPRMNDVLKAARGNGALVIHAPSSCMDPYADSPARLRAQRAPRAANLPSDIGRWCNWKDAREQEEGYPIDHSDGGEDDDPHEHGEWYAKLEQMGRNPWSPWVGQTDLLEIDPQRDAISDRGVEIWNLLEERGIQNVILLGVHANMCVLGRPFGLRQLSKNGKNVVLMRDMTDTMYNPARFPYVSHFRGTDLVVEHIERLVCPTITSDQLIGGEPFRFRGDRRPHIVIAISEPEYHTGETLPKLAKQLWVDEQGDSVTVVQGDPDQHEIAGLAPAVRDADVVVLSIRRQALPSPALAALRDHLESGRPLIAIRTSSHAFDARGQGPADHEEWPQFDPEVLGGNYHGHHGSGPVVTVSIAPGVVHPVVRGISGPFRSQGSLYKASPLASSAQPLLMGRIPQQPPEPVAWVNSYGPHHAKVFYTSLGHERDFEVPQFRRLMNNALKWATGGRIPLTMRDFQADWQDVCMPRPWSRILATDALADYEGWAWYRCLVKLPRADVNRDLTLNLGTLDGSDETFFNGHQVGSTGSLPPPNDVSPPDNQRVYVVPSRIVKAGQWNTLAIRTYVQKGHGGIRGGRLALGHGDNSVRLQGTWQMRIGDDANWARAAGPSSVTEAARYQ